MRKKLPFLIMFVVHFAIMVAGIAVVFFVSAHYQPLFGMPENKDAVIDFGDYNKLNVPSTSPNLSGDFEFFYNRWIITDNDTGQPDGVIQLPGRWTGKQIQGQALPNTGYASYRVVIKNPTEAQSAVVKISSPNVAYRTFINGELNATCGTISKDRKTAITGNSRTTIKRYNFTAGETMTLVIEIADNIQGGLLVAPQLHLRANAVPSYNFIFNIFPYLLVGGIAVALFFCGFMPVKTSKRENRLTLSAVIIMLLLHYLTTKDTAILTVDVFLLNGTFLPFFRYITGILLVLTHIWHMHADKSIVISRTEGIFFFCVNGIAVISYFLLIGSVFQIITVLISLATLLWVSYKITTNASEFGYFTAQLTINNFLFAALLFETLDSQGILSFGFEALFSFGLLIILMAIVFLNFFKIRENEKKLMAATKAEAEIANMKRQSLKAQIKPHFVFNSLSAIQAVYRKDSREGEEMLTRFSQHLRANVDSDDKELIPFEEELNNMLNYFELENLRCENKLSLILNVEHLDFCVPVLSLQPLLENAVKYAGTENIENGFIQISSALTKSGILVEVSDNGRGFEPENIRQGAVGLKNVTDRLKYGLDAQVLIKSELGLGTTITILIPDSSVAPYAKSVKNPSVKRKMQKERKYENTGS